MPLLTRSPGFSMDAQSSVCVPSATTVISAGSANTYGSWVSLGYTALWDIDAILVQLSANNNPATTRNAYVDIGIGGTDNGTIIEKLCGSHAGTNDTGGGARRYLCPVRIPAGAALYAKHQNTAASTNITVDVTAWGGASNPGMFPSGSKLEVIGASGSTVGTSITPGTSGEGSWTQITASTAKDYMGVMVGGMFTVDTTMNVKWMVCDVAVGAGGSERSIGENIMWSSHDGSERATSMSLPVFCPVAAGSRIAVRCACSTSPDSSQSVVVYGIVP